MNKASTKLDKIIEHIKFGNYKFASLEAAELQVELEKSTTTTTCIGVEDDNFNIIKQMVQLKYGDSRPFCFGLALLLHSAGQMKEAQILFSLTCEEPDNGP